MKIHYLPEDSLRQFGFSSFSPITLKGGETVKEIDKADIVFIPLPLREITGPGQEASHLDRLRLPKIIKHFNLDERRVVAYDCSDWEEDYSSTAPNCLFIRCNTKGWMKRKMPRTISWPWPVENFGDQAAPPKEGYKFDVSAHMWLSHNVRIHACDSIQRQLGDRADIVTRKEFYGYIERDDPARALQLKQAFKESMRVSKLSLCPASIPNVFPYRFFEAMSAGRVPVLFCTDYVLPWADVIPWDQCVFRFESDECVKAGEKIRDILAWRTEDLEAMGQRGRQMWDRYLNRDKYPELMYEAIERVMQREGLIR